MHSFDRGGGANVAARHGKIFLADFAFVVPSPLALRDRPGLAIGHGLSMVVPSFNNTVKVNGGNVDFGDVVVAFDRVDDGGSGGSIVMGLSGG